MENEQNPNNEQTSNIEYINKIKELQANTVPKSELEKAKEREKNLLDALTKGQTIETSKEEKSLKEIRDSLFTENSNLTNLEFAQNALLLREKLLKEGKTDPFLPIGSQITPTHEDEECAERVALGLQSCIEIAEGDPFIFTNELQRVMIDTKIRK